MKYFVLAVFIMMISIPVLAQQPIDAGAATPSLVREVHSRFEVTTHGDQIIRSQVVLEDLSTHAMTTVDVQGGTVDGLTLVVSGHPVPKPGDRVVRKGNVISVQENFTTFGTWDLANMPVVENVNPANSDVDPAAAEAAIAVAEAAWSAAGTPFTYAVGAEVSDTVNAIDGRNVILFRDDVSPDGPSVIASTYAWINYTGHIFDADIVFYSGAWTFFVGTDGCSSGAYIEDIAAHELGHVLGLGHTDVADATMYPYYSTCSQELRSLAPDDIAGIQSLYGATGEGTGDTTAPVIEQFSATRWNKAQFRVHVMASDDVGVAGIVITANGAAVKTCTATTLCDANVRSGAGQNVFRTDVMDAAGNRSSATLIVP